MATIKPVTLGPFPAGMDNMREDSELTDPDKGDLLRHAVNVDLSNSGQIRRRKGYTLAAGVPLPPSHDGLSCQHMGRTVRAEGSYLRWTDPWSEHETPTKNFLPFPSDITAVFSTETGLFIGADQTYYLAGDVVTTALAVASPTRIVKGSVSTIPHEKLFVWLSSAGLARGTPDGQVTLMQRQHVEVGVIDPNATGATLYRAQAGLRQVIGIINSAPDDGVVAIGDYMDAELVRIGV